MDNVVQFEKPDRPENVEALRAMVRAVRTAMGMGMDKETFLSVAPKVWDGVILSDLSEEVDG